MPECKTNDDCDMENNFVCDPVSNHCVKSNNPCDDESGYRCRYSCKNGRTWGAGPDSELNNRDKCKIDDTNAAQWSTACHGKGIEEIHEGTPFYGCRSDLPMPECKTNGDCDMENNFVCKNKKCVL
jgi:hypothetical protein